MANTTQDFNSKGSYPPLPTGLRDWIQRTLGQLPLPLCVDFWGDPIHAGEGSQPLVTLRIHHPGVLRRVILSRNPLNLVDAYLEGWVDLEGRLDDLLPLVQKNPHVQPMQGRDLWTLAWGALRLPELPQGSRAPYEQNLQKPIDHAPGQDQQAIQYHYDAGNAFYELWLDPLMVYSCAHFEDPGMSLAQAQVAKLDLICRKLRLAPGETLLDIGCGWGSLLEWAATHYGIRGVGITLSEEQCRFAQARMAAAGLSDQVEIKLLDYRALPRDPSFDKVVSVGMVEHVGFGNYPAYFGKALQVLKPGGLFLNHGINSAIPWNGSRWGEKFIRRYIFPNGELATLSMTLSAAEAAGWEVVDIDNWRPHYAHTTRAWADRFDQVREQVDQLMGSRMAEIWRLYLVGCVTGFADGHIGVYQTLLRRRQDPQWELPLSRSGWVS